MHISRGNHAVFTLAGVTYVEVVMRQFRIGIGNHFDEGCSGRSVGLTVSAEAKIAPDFWREEKKI